MILLDTDTVTLLFYGDEAVKSRLEQAEEDVAVTVITRIEILRGRFDFLMKAANGNQLEQALKWLHKSEQDLETQTIVEFDTAAFKEFDKLRKNKKLKAIGRGDLLIACIALANRATLITRNIKHFERVPRLKVENWSK